MKHIFVVNPAAGDGMAVKELLPRIHQALEGFEDDYEIHRTLNAHETALYCRQKCAFEGRVRLYAVGGDGTVNNVLQGIAGFKNAELAILPSGSGDDFVRNFASSKPFLDIPAMIRASTQKVDVIKYNDMYSINMCNIGTDSAIVEKVAERKSDRLKGSLAYAVSALEVLATKPLYEMVYSFDDGEEKQGHFFLSAIGNGRFCGGGFKSCPKASLTDGLMDVCMVSQVKGPAIISELLRYRKGTHLKHKSTRRYIEYRQCRKFHLKALTPATIALDGEVMPFEEGTFEIIPKFINLVVPEGFVVS